MTVRVATEQEKEAIFALRMEVFVEEQKVPRELELDTEDSHALHVLAEEDGVVIGCARVLLQDGAHIGRLAVKKAYRGRGVGAAICRFIIDHCQKEGYGRIWLGAQLHAWGFYEKLGFKQKGAPFWEAGIEHIEMELV